MIVREMLFVLVLTLESFLGLGFLAPAYGVRNTLLKDLKKLEAMKKEKESEQQRLQKLIEAVQRGDKVMLEHYAHEIAGLLKRGEIRYEF